MMKTVYSHKISIVLNAYVKHIEAYIFPVLVNISHKGLLVLLAMLAICYRPKSLDTCCPLQL